MPKIAAATIVENRELRRAALLDAASELITDRGTAAIAVADVAAAVGLSRSSVYEYYDSSADLVADVVMRELEQRPAAIATALGASSTTEDAISTWIRLAVESSSALVRTAQTMDVPPNRQADLTAIRVQMVAPLRARIDTDDAMFADHIQAITDAAITRIAAGADREAETISAITFCLAAWRNHP